MRVKPAPGLKVRNESGRHIPGDKFIEVPENTYWLRRVGAGDVVREDVPAPVRPRPRGPADDPDRNSVVIPADWNSLHWPQARSLAASLCGEPVTNGAQARAIIEAEIERRARENS